MDVPVQRSGNELMTSVFRKKTHTEWYLNFRSYHHPCIKTGIISYLKNRAHNICSEEALETEVKHLTTAFQSNRYPSWVIHRALIKEKKSRKEHKEGENPKTLYIPYISKVSAKRFKNASNI